MNEAILREVGLHVFQYWWSINCVLPDAQLSPQLLQFLESPLSSLLLSTPAFTFSLGHAFMGSARSNQLLLLSPGHRFRHYSGGVDWVHPFASPGECFPSLVLMHCVWHLSGSIQDPT